MEPDVTQCTGGGAGGVLGHARCCRMLMSTDGWPGKMLGALGWWSGGRGDRPQGLYISVCGALIDELSDSVSDYGSLSCTGQV